jgi:hypothetical protein
MLLIKLSFLTHTIGVAGVRGVVVVGVRDPTDDCLTGMVGAIDVSTEVMYLLLLWDGSTNRTRLVMGVAVAQKSADDASACSGDSFRTGNEQFTFAVGVGGCTSSNRACLIRGHTSGDMDEAYEHVLSDDQNSSKEEEEEGEHGSSSNRLKEIFERDKRLSCREGGRGLIVTV